MEEKREAKLHKAGVNPIPRSLLGNGGLYKILPWVGEAVLGYCELVIAGRAIWLWMVAQ